MLDKRIIYTAADDSLKVIHPAADAGVDWIDRALRTRVPNDARNVIMIAADKLPPRDDPFRNAWRFCEKNGVRHCMPTARNIHRDRMREKRKLLFSEVDAAFMRAQMQGLSTAEIAAQAQQLRDIPASEQIEQVQSLDELKELWPLDVLGDTPYVPAPPPPAQGYETHTFTEGNTFSLPDEPQAAPEAEQVDLEEFLAAVPPPAVNSQPEQPRGRRGDWKAAAAAVSLAEDFDAPLPEYVEPPPEPTAADVFDVTREFKQAPAAAEQQQPARKLLREAVTKARAELSEDRSDYDIAVMALHGNNEQAANLDLTAKRLGIPMQDVADEIIANWRGCERALTAVRELNEIALAEMVQRPGESHAIVNQAIALINEQVGNATSYRS